MQSKESLLKAETSTHIEKQEHQNNIKLFIGNFKTKKDLE